MNKLKQQIKVLTELLAIMKPNEELLDSLEAINMYGVKATLNKLKKSVEFNIEIKGYESSGEWYNVLSYSAPHNECIALYSESNGRQISWSDDGSQPDGEWLYSISFPTGAYIFGDSYPTNTFREFFEELKGYGHKYIDTANHTLYFTKENAHIIHNDFRSIYEKHKESVDGENRAKKIAKMKLELEKLENNND